MQIFYSFLGSDVEKQMKQVKKYAQKRKFIEIHTDDYI